MDRQKIRTGFAYLLSLWRTRKDLTLRDVADKGHFSHSYMSLAENGVKDPTRDFLPKLAVGLDLSPIQELVLKLQYVYPRPLNTDDQVILQDIAEIIDNYDYGDYQYKHRICEMIKRRKTQPRRNELPIELAGLVACVIAGDEATRKETITYLREVFKEEFRRY